MTIGGGGVPRATVILTSYNRPKLVTDAIESVREQTIDDWQLLIADDDSNDETQAAIIVASDNDPRIKHLWLPPGSVDPAARAHDQRFCASINRALPHVRGRYVCYLVDDDYFYPRSIECRAAVLDMHADVHVVYGRLRSVSYDKDTEWDTSGRPRSGRSYPKYGDMDPETGKITNPATWERLPLSPMGGRLDHNMFMHRRVCLDEMGGPPWWPVNDFTGRIGDAAFLDRLDALGHVGCSVDEFVCTKRYHGYNEGRMGSGAVRE